MTLTVEQMSYLLAVVSAIATLAGLGFTFYGLYNVNHAERIVDRKLEARLVQIEASVKAQMVQAQEALQKIMAAYALSQAGNHEGAIGLLEAAVTADPAAFNGYTTLAYEYLAVGKKHEAIECFHKASRIFPDRPEPYNDLARVYAQEGEDRLALKFIEETLKRKPGCWKDIDGDRAFDGPRQRCSTQYDEIIGRCRLA